MECADAGLVLETVVLAEVLRSSVDTVRNGVDRETSVKSICRIKYAYGQYSKLMHNNLLTSFRFRPSRAELNKADPIPDRKSDPVEPWLLYPPEG